MVAFKITHTDAKIIYKDGFVCGIVVSRGQTASQISIENILNPTPKLGKRENQLTIMQN